MKVWAIRVKNTDLYLPYKSRNHSRATPVSISILPPRWHATKRGAQNALTAWLQGVWHCRGYDEHCALSPKFMLGRERASMEIVEFTLREIQEKYCAAKPRTSNCIFAARAKALGVAY
jgi:hypothetical protein